MPQHFAPERNRMHYVTRISHWMQKHMFGVRCPGVLFTEIAPSPPEKLCIDILCPGRTRMHYLTHRSYRMQKYKFGVTCSDTLFMETASGPPEHEK
jgi:hypothetical protein